MVRTFSIIFGTIFALLGFSGFVSNPLVGANALFAAGAVYNAMHLVFAAVLFAATFRRGGDAELALRIIGAVTFLLGFIGLLSIPSSGGSLFAVAYTNGAMNWFHIVVGIAVFFALRYESDDRTPPSAG